MIDKISLDLTFESRLYKDMLDKNIKKNNKEFNNKFIEKMEKSSKFGKQ